MLFCRSRNPDGVNANDDRLRLVKYTAYAVGVPCLVTAVTAVVEFLPESYEGVRPNFGTRACYFDTKLANFVFFHLLMIIMQVSNAIFFILTIKALYTTWRKARKLQQRSKRSQKSTEQVKVILKLFVVMGVTWLSELIYFMVGWIFGRDIVWKFFIINDFINFSQGNQIASFSKSLIHLIALW